MTTEIQLIIEGVKNRRTFREFSRELNGIDLAISRRSQLLAQTGLPDWQPNITKVTIQTREVTDWEDFNG